MFALHPAITFKGSYAFTDINLLPGVQDQFYLYRERSPMKKDLGQWMMLDLCDGAKLAGKQSQ